MNQDYPEGAAGEALYAQAVVDRLVELTNADVLEWNAAQTATFGRLSVYVHRFVFTWRLEVRAINDQGARESLGLEFTREQAGAVAAAMKASHARALVVKKAAFAQARELARHEKAERAERLEQLKVERAALSQGRAERRDTQSGSGDETEAETTREADDRRCQLRALALRQLLEGRVDVGEHEVQPMTRHDRAANAGIEAFMAQDVKDQAAMEAIDGLVAQEAVDEASEVAAAEAMVQAAEHGGDER